MILVADSGSTKTNWLCESVPLIETIGFNPFFHTTDFIYGHIQAHPALMALRDQVTEIYFYGAGCSSEARNGLVETAIRRHFERATVLVDHDLKAAAYATYDGRACISCIIGTGSNSCLFDGQNIDNRVPALGYILGDEAGGSYFGKRLLSAYLYGELPTATQSLMEGQYGLTKEKIFWSVYNEPNANVYLAGFAKLLTQSPDQEYMLGIVVEGFTAFFKHHVLCYTSAAHQYPVHFVGSIAHYFQPQLAQVAESLGCELGVVDKQPVFKLLAWHQQLHQGKTA
jgi:glucosamine kinase